MVRLIKWEISILKIKKLTELGLSFLFSFLKLFKCNENQLGVPIVVFIIYFLNFFFYHEFTFNLTYENTYLFRIVATRIYNVYFAQQLLFIHTNTTDVFRGLHGAVPVVGARAEAAGHRRLHHPIRQAQVRRRRRSSQEDQGPRLRHAVSSFQWRS